jgi:hypothetical protein
VRRREGIGKPVYWVTLVFVPCRLSHSITEATHYRKTRNVTLLQLEGVLERHALTLGIAHQKYPEELAQMRSVFLQQYATSKQ